MAAVFEMAVLCSSKGGANAVEFRTPDSSVVSHPDGRIVITGMSQSKFDLLKVGQNYKMEVSTLVALKEEVDEPVKNTGSFEEVKKEEVSIKDRIEALSRAQQQQQSKVIPPTPPYRR
jgi:hypothetical protein